jgi:dihydroorotase
MSTRLGLRGWPNAAEDLIVRANVILSEYTGAHIHLQHISSKFSVDVIRRAKQRGAESPRRRRRIILRSRTTRSPRTTPNFKMNPPLRTEEDRRALIDGLARRHAGHHSHRPRAAYRLREGQGVRLRAERILGLETALPYHPRNSWCGRTGSSCRSWSI